MFGCQEFPKLESAQNANPPILTDQKRCTKCGEIKLLSEFYRDRSPKDGHTSECKACKSKRVKIWYAENPGKAKENQKKASEKRRSTAKGKLSNAMSGSIWHSLNENKAGRHWEFLVGYTIDDLKKHLQRKFQPGMTWDNYGEWQIDHRIPISVFNFETPEDIDFKKCWALKNLQPMWKVDNLKKHNKIDKPFQPSFVF